MPHSTILHTTQLIHLLHSNKTNLPLQCAWIQSTSRALLGYNLSEMWTRFPFPQPYILFVLYHTAWWVRVLPLTFSRFFYDNAIGCLLLNPFLPPTKPLSCSQWTRLPPGQLYLPPLQHGSTPIHTSVAVMLKLSQSLHWLFSASSVGFCSPVLKIFGSNTPAAPPSPWSYNNSTHTRFQWVKLCLCLIQRANNQYKKFQSCILLSNLANINNNNNMQAYIQTMEPVRHSFVLSSRPINKFQLPVLQSTPACHISSVRTDGLIIPLLL